MGLSTSLIKLLLGLFNLVFCVRPLRIRKPLSTAFALPRWPRTESVALVGSW